MGRKEIEEVYVKKINKLKKYDEAYFKYDSPIISDKDYDDIKQEILNLEKKYNFLKNKNSPSQKVGYKPSGKFKKVAHDVPMLSLSNAFSEITALIKLEVSSGAPILKLLQSAII